MKLTRRQALAINQIVEAEIQGVTESRDVRYETLARDKLLEAGKAPKRKTIKAPRVDDAETLSAELGDVVQDGDTAGVEAIISRFKKSLLAKGLSPKDVEAAAKTVGRFALKAADGFSRGSFSDRVYDAIEQAQSQIYLNLDETVMSNNDKQKLHEKFGAFDVADKNVLGGEYGEEDVMMPHNFENAAKEQYLILLDPISEQFVESHLDLVDGMGPGARETYHEDLINLSSEMHEELLAVIEKYSAKFTEML